MPKHLILVMSLLAAVILLTMLNFTTPTGAGPFGVLLCFMLFYILMFGLAMLIVKIYLKIMGKQMGRKSYVYGAVIAFGPITLLLARSLGAMQWWTVLLVAGAVFLACFLVSKKF